MEAIYIEPLRSETPQTGILLDWYDTYEQPEQKSEDFAALHFQRIQRFPLLTADEERDLLQRWCAFKERKAADRIIEAHLRIVPPIARKAAIKYGFEPSWNLLPPGTEQDAFIGYGEVVTDLTAEGNLALVEALNGFDLSWPVLFYTYASICVRNKISRYAVKLISVVDRPYGGKKLAKFDLSIDPQKPDVLDFGDNFGFRGAAATSSDDLSDARTTPRTRLRPPPKEPEIIFDPDALNDEDSSYRAIAGLSRVESRIVCGHHLIGMTLQEIAGEVGMSVSTVWRMEKSALDKLARLNA
jgi:RNA polymerase sigma factor (sigma-70 family)